MPDFPLDRWCVRIGWFALAAALAVAALCRQEYRRWPALTVLPLQQSAVWTSVPAVSNDYSAATLVFHKLTREPPVTGPGPLAKRFRLAGTFFSAAANQLSRKAILDDCQKKEQQLVGESDLIENSIIVVSIQTDRVILRDETHEEELLLSFTRPTQASPEVLQSAGLATNQMASSSTNRFGKLVGDNRWVLQRSELLKYYQELLNNTDRLAKVFESMKPVYQANKVSGYVVDVEGEADMFAAFGLKQGDIVKQLNSMPMISQARAEYFIREFVNNRVNAFVLDIERDSKPEKFIYMVR